jgi:DNA-binding MarR family transcriptional regulator
VSSPEDQAQARVEAWRAMLYANDRLLQRLNDELLEHHGLEMSWYEVLMHIAEAGGTISQRALLGRALLGQSGLSRLLTKMEGAGLIRRSAQEADRRTLDIELTRLGRDRLRRAAPTHVAGIRRWFGDQLTARQAESIRTGLQKVVRGLDLDAPLGPQGKGETGEPVAIGPSIVSLAAEPVSVSDTLAVRDALEPLVVADAVRYATPADVADLHRHLNVMAAEIDSPVRFLQADWALHRRMCTISPNDALQSAYLKLLRTLEENVDDVVPYRGLEKYLREMLQLHARLLTAIDEGDLDRAAALAAEHRLSATGPDSAPNPTEAHTQDSDQPSNPRRRSRTR